MNAYLIMKMNRADRWGDGLIKRLIAIILLTLFFTSCSNNKILTNTPDFHGTFLLEEERISLVVVDNNMTQEDITFFRSPDEWEAYVIKWDADTIFLDESGTEITEEEFQQHDHIIKIWTKETFKKEVTELNTGDDEKLTEIYPVYKARQIQLVEMKMEDYLKRQVSFEDGKLAVLVFLGEEISNDDNALYKFQTELNEFMQNQRDIHSYSFSLGMGSKRDVQFLEIEDYPVFFVFDHAKLIYKTYEQAEFIDFIENY